MVENTRLDTVPNTQLATQSPTLPAVQEPQKKPAKSGMEAVRPRMEQQIRAIRECFARGDFDLAAVHSKALTGIFEALHSNPRRARKMVIAICPECSHCGPIPGGICQSCHQEVEVD